MFGLDYLLKHPPGTQTATTAGVHQPPTIRNIRWAPSRVVNGKVYDGSISFEAEGTNSPVVGAELTFGPIYPQELSMQAFTPEPSRSFALSSHAMSADFSQTIQNLIGGKQYRAQVTVKDQYGAQNQASLDIPYVRELESILHLTKLDVSASYMPWDFASNLQAWKREIPLMGAYDSEDDNVKMKHIDWANGHGIAAFFVDGGEWAGHPQRAPSVLTAFLRAGMRAAIQVSGDPWGGGEENGGGYVSGTRANAPRFTVDLSYQRNHDAFITMVKRWLDEGFFTYSSYYKINSRPIIFIYNAKALIDETQTFKEMRGLIRDNVGADPFIIGELTCRIPTLPADSEAWYFDMKDLRAYDAMTSWAGMHNQSLQQRDQIYSTNYEHYYEIGLRAWRDFAHGRGLKFIPPVIAGFDNSYSWGPTGFPVVRDPALFEKRMRIASKYVDDDLKQIRIDTWNDFGEWTYIEPSSTTGFEFVDLLKKTLIA